jgi:hypothetical protein
LHAKGLFVSEGADFTQLAHRLRSVTHNDGSIEAAQVRVIGLDEIREAAGTNWPRMRERVRAGSMEILSRHAAPDDVIVPAGDGFLVILAEGAAGATQERCVKMREALLTFYLGEEAFKMLRPQVTAHTLSSDGLADLMFTGVNAASAASGGLARMVRDDIVEARVFSARESKVMGRWYCAVREERGVRRLAYSGDFILDGRHHDPGYFDLDIAIFEAACAELERANEDPLAIGFTVHASTLQTRRGRDAYLAALSTLKPAKRQRAIVTIAEIEKGTPLISIAEWCSALRSVVTRVALDFHYTDHALGSVGAAGAWAAGFHLPIYSGAQRGPRAARTLDQIRFWSKSMRAQGMRLAVNGFSDPEFLRQGAAGGVDIATSDVLWPFKRLAEATEAASSQASAA